MKKLLALIMAVIFILSFAACGKNTAETFGRDSDVPAFKTKVMAGGDFANSMVEEAVQLDSADSAKLVYSGNRKIIRNAEISLSTEKYTETVKAINKAVAEYEGYIEASNEENYDDFTSLCSTVRIPTEKLDAFLNAVGGAATVTSKSISSDDITSSYADTESHLKALHTEQDTLLELLKKATTLTDTLEIQDRLTQVRSNIEYYQSMMNTYDDELSYSTVNMYVNEVEHEIATGSGFWSNMWTGLKESIYDIGVGIANFFSWIIVHIPYIVIFAVIVLVLYVIIKKVLKKKRDKKLLKEDKNAGQTNSGDVPSEK